jgi:SAM-dependent methyltransferase
MNANAKPESDQYEEYFHYLQKITLRGRIYKRYVSSPILFLCARTFGQRIAEVGSGIGSGVLGAFPSRVVGLEINPFAVEYSKTIELNASLIKDDGRYPAADEAFDACILDNVLEHIESPRQTLDECWRVTQPGGGLVIAVPGIRGFARDPDHKVFYEKKELEHLDPRWKMKWLLSIPTLFRSAGLSRAVRQYCLVAVYRKEL